MQTKAIWTVVGIAAVFAIVAFFAVGADGDPGDAQSLLNERDEAIKIAKELAAASDQARKVIAELEGGIPAGTIVSYAGPCDVPKNIPIGWLLCDGTIYDGADSRYERLFGSIGKTWGTEEGTPSTESTSAPKKQHPFRVPDLRGRFLRGHSRDSNTDPDAVHRTDLSGKVIGNLVGSYQNDQVGPHEHALDQKPHSHGIPVRDGDGGDNGIADGEDRLDGHPHSDPATIEIKVLANTGSESRPKNASVNYLIKL